MKETVVYPPSIPAGAKRVLEDHMGTKGRIRLHYGDLATGRDWLEEHFVEGYVHRSHGEKPIPLIVHNARSTGGDAISANIVKIRSLGWGMTYEHPTYHYGMVDLREIDDVEHDLHAEVTVDGKPHARFKTMKQAERWLKRMGLRLWADLLVSGWRIA